MRFCGVPAIAPHEVQRPGWAAHHYRRDGVGRGGAGLDPRPALRIIAYWGIAYFAASFLTVVTFRIVDGMPTVFASSVPENSGDSLSLVRQSQ